MGCMHPQKMIRVRQEDTRTGIDEPTAYSTCRERATNQNNCDSWKSARKLSIILRILKDLNGVFRCYSKA